MSIRTKFVASELTAAFLFFACPIAGLSYLIWDFEGLLFGGGISVVGLATLFLLTRPVAQTPQDRRVEALETQMEEGSRAAEATHELLRQREEELALLEEQFAELKGFAEGKQEEAYRLSCQVEELRGEIRRLLNLEPISDQGALPLPPVDHEEDHWAEHLPESSRREVTNQYDAHALLHHCLERAETLTGVRQLVGPSRRFEELSMGDYAIDLRQLFEAFRGEPGGAIMVYSPKEERLLFTSNLIRGLLGWSPERFVRDYNWLVRKGADSWNQVVQDLECGEEAHLELALRSASDEEIPVGCALGRIHSGAFQGLILAVLYRIG